MPRKVHKRIVFDRGNVAMRLLQDWYWNKKFHWLPEWACVRLNEAYRQRVSVDCVRHYMLARYF